MFFIEIYSLRHILNVLENIQFKSKLIQTLTNSNTSAEKWTVKYPMNITRLQYTLNVKTNELNKYRNLVHVCFVRYHYSVFV